jgi:hypothetical protein
VRVVGELEDRVRLGAEALGMRLVRLERDETCWWILTRSKWYPTLCDRPMSLPGIASLLGVGLGNYTPPLPRKTTTPRPPAESTDLVLPHLQTGYENRITRPQLRDLTGLTDRQVGVGVQVLRRRGIGVCTNSHGAWIEEEVTARTAAE